MSIYGSSRNKTPSSTISEGELDMSGHKITNLKTPTTDDDATTFGIVKNYFLSLQRSKVNWAGGAMTGTLNMGTHKITNVGNPENDNDVTSKQYVDEKTKRVTFSKLGRYVVVEGENKTYFSVRAKKNIDLDNELQVELKNLTGNNGKVFNTSISTISIDFTAENIPDKRLGFLRCNPGQRCQINFNRENYLMQPWVLLFSVRLGNTFPRLTIQISTKQSDTILLILLETNSIKYAITNDVNNSRNATTFNVDTTQFNHVAFEYTGTKLTMHLNGEQKKMHNNVTLNELSTVRIGGSGDLGILSLYNKNLNKQEIIEHFVDYHVSNFTNDEVLI